MQVQEQSGKTGESAPTLYDEWRSMVRQFVRERDWDQHHNPKNLAMCMAVEAAEVMEHFQWMPDAQSADLSSEKRRAVSHELADVLMGLIRLADLLDVDMDAAFKEKMALNCAKYPPEKVRGRALKYTELDD